MQHHAQDSNARYTPGTYKRHNKNKRARNSKMIFNSNNLTLPNTNQFVALDCEMVGVGPNGTKSSLARVTIINFRGKVLMDEHIRQKQTVTDYRTFVSGITKEDLDEATLTLERCRAKVLRLLHNKILVGHALKNDLEVLGIDHPWWMIRDTATYQPFMKLRGGAYWPIKLKHLVKHYLEEDIQVYGQPHSPYEDALAALNLYKHVQTTWESKMQSQVNQIYMDNLIEWEHYHQQVYQQQQYFVQQGYNRVPVQ